MKSAAAIVLKYGEVFLKKGRRRFFLDILAANLERLLRQIAPHLKLKRPYGRFLVVPRTEGERIDQPGAVVEALARVFGIVAAEPCEIVNAPTPDNMVEAVAQYALTHRRRAHKTFKIDTNRADKRYPMNSIECNRVLGSAVYTALGDVEVDLHTPDFTIKVEIRDEIGLISGARTEGVGGLPVGSNGRALLLLSGGIDSPVAGWLTQRRGVAIDTITFLSPPYTGPKAREKVETLARFLAKPQKNMRHMVVEIAPLQERYRDNAPPNQLVLLYRRSMFRIADSIAQQNKHGALITGENLGQVASQTMPNLHCIESVCTQSVLRPLLTYDKREIIDLAKRIGTYETSIQPYDDCCSLFVPKHPELRGRINFLERLESEIEPFALEQEALEKAHTLEF
jgi:thiamine biosynthesis protein ThiI